MEREEVRRIVLETLIELAVQPTRSRESLCVGLDAHKLLTGKPFEEQAYQDQQLVAAYPHLVPKATAQELSFRALAEGKAKPICIWTEADARAYYSATEQDRADWNVYAQREADKASDSLDANESLGQYTSVGRDGKIYSWAPPLWFPEWLAQRAR